MLKVLLAICFTAVCISETSVLKGQTYIPREFEFPHNVLVFPRSTDEIASQWGPHVMDFLELIDMEKIVMVVMQYLNDPEVMTFMKFMFSSEFTEVIWDFENMEEFKEAYAFLDSRGYDVESVMVFVNTVLNLPPFEKLNNPLRTQKGVSGFLEAMANNLPLEDIKKLFESKLVTVPEIANLFETINSQEFMDIMRKMRKNPKFVELKMIFESYGFDFKFICKLAKEIFGDYYQGIFCE